MLINFPGSLQEGGLRVTAFHRGGLRSWRQGRHLRNKALLSSVQAPKQRSLGRGRRKDRAPGLPLCLLPSWETPANSLAIAAHLPPWQMAGEMGSWSPDCGGRDAWQRPAGMLPLTPGLPLANPLLPWTQTILSLSLSSAVGVPVWISHHTVLIID